MRSEPYESKSGRRVWLNKNELEQFVEKYKTSPRRQLALKLMGYAGLRTHEVTMVSREGIREIESDESRVYRLRVHEDAKTGYREVPIPREIALQIRTVANAANEHKDEPLVNYHPETLGRWVKDAAKTLHQETDKDDWQYVRAHDCRRSWATRTYYRLDGARAKDLVMSWGGWTKEQTFVENYLGRPPVDVESEALSELEEFDF